MQVNQGQPMMDPNLFVTKFNDEFLPKLQAALAADSRGGQITYVGNSRCPSVQGIDVDIEDKNGITSSFYLDPFTWTFSAVFNR
ncbi:hypothetical protein NVP1081O_109 [Vibrio phage 1.081.O._10N.286.52.C2]|nr:hypothetical protein NVP1081O_109 [Vibrio phage 1.081.O._10N.286.52.C2]